METGIRIYEMQDRNLQKKGNKMNNNEFGARLAKDDGECRVLHVRQSGGSVSRSGDAIANWVNESVTVSK